MLRLYLEEMNELCSGTPNDSPLWWSDGEKEKLGVPTQLGAPYSRQRELSSREEMLALGQQLGPQKEGPVTEGFGNMQTGMLWNLT